MTFEKVVQSLTKLVDTHQQLISLSEEKTEFIKAGKVEELQNKLLQERKLVLQLEQAEAERQKVISSWFEERGLTEEEKTITSMLAAIDDEEQQAELAAVTTELTEAVTTLKRSEHLNRELLEQSMQFVQMSLHLLNPSLEQMNYGENKQNQPNRDQSMFDSKA